MSKDIEKHGCVLLLAVLALAPLDTVWRAFVAMKLWGWFAVPAVHVEPISLGLAFGLMLVVEIFTMKHKAPKPTPDVAFSALVAHWVSLAVLSPLIALALGYLVHISN